jgi:hypothetical protein
MARLKPDNPDIARTFAICPATSLPGQTGHIPLGMSACPVSGPEEVGRWRKAIERRGWKTAPHRHQTDNVRKISAIDLDRSEKLTGQQNCSALQVVHRTLTVSRDDNSLPRASRLGDLLRHGLNSLCFSACARCVPVIGSSETREFQRNASNQTAGKKTRVGVPGGRSYWPAYISTCSFSHAAPSKTVLHFGQKFWAADFETRVYK